MRFIHRRMQKFLSYNLSAESSRFEHASTLNTVNNLGNLYSDQGKLDEAETMYVRALQGFKAKLGAEH